jgi:hypothetical protein
MSPEKTAFCSARMVDALGYFFLYMVLFIIFSFLLLRKEVHGQGHAKIQL